MSDTFDRLLKDSEYQPSVALHYAAAEIDNLKVANDGLHEALTRRDDRIAELTRERDGFHNDAKLLGKSLESINATLTSVGSGYFWGMSVADGVEALAAAYKKCWALLSKGDQEEMLK